MKYTKENEKEYYNQKLLKETFQDEIKKPHKFDWKEAVLLLLGLILGFIVTDIIGLEELISNKILRYTAEIFILVIAIAAVNAFAVGFKKLMTNK